MLKKVGMYFCLIISVFLVGCDLSHKHYTDDFGVCRNCNTDISVMIQKDQNENYLVTDFTLQYYTDTYLKFVSNGESELTITIECDAADIESIILYSKIDDYIASKYDRNNPVLVCNEQLERGEIYYIRIKSDKAADARVILEA